jgi:hypothetical protein
MTSMLSEVEGPKGYSLQLKLAPGDRDVLEKAIRNQYLSRIRQDAPDHIEWFENNSIYDYHLGCKRLEHNRLWGKKSRTFSADVVSMIKSLDFMSVLAKEFGRFEISGESGFEKEEIYWRLVRPREKEDVGPVHADQWFWNLGNGATPAGVQRVKVWIAVMTEAGRNGLKIVPGSHRHEWQWHGEFRDGIMKPVFDQDPETIGLELPEFTPGQAIVFNDRLLHVGAVNSGDKTRVSIEFTLFTHPSQHADASAD